MNYGQCQTSINTKNGLDQKSFAHVVSTFCLESATNIGIAFEPALVSKNSQTNILWVECRLIPAIRRFHFNMVKSIMVHHSLLLG